MKYYHVLLLDLILFFSIQGCLMAGEMNCKIDFKKEIEEGQLKLIIYYNTITKLITIPLSDESIRNGEYEYKIIVNAEALSRELAELEKFNNLKLIKNENGKNDAIANRRILCEFRTKDEKLLLSYSIGIGKYIFVNEKPVRINRFLVDFIEKFLPCDVSDYYKEITRNWEF